MTRQEIVNRKNEIDSLKLELEFKNFELDLWKADIQARVLNTDNPCKLVPELADYVMQSNMVTFKMLKLSEEYNRINKELDNG